MPVLNILAVRLIYCCLRAFRWEAVRRRLLEFAVYRLRAHGHLIGSPIARTRFGFLLELDLGDRGDQLIYVTGTHEDHTARIMKSLIGRGDNVVDIGANIGFFSLLAARRVGHDGHVWSFEPADTARSRLRHNIKLNGYTNLTVSDVAVSDAAGTCTFHCGPRHHSGLSSLRPLERISQSYEVKTRTLPSCVPRNTMLHLIKMDIEGAEYRAFLGMEDILRRQLPDILVEITDSFLKDMGSSASETYGFLRSIGYRMYYIAPNTLVEIPEWKPGLPPQFNALFTVRNTSVVSRCLAVGSP